VPLCPASHTTNLTTLHLWLWVFFPISPHPFGLRYFFFVDSTLPSFSICLPVHVLLTPSTQRFSCALVFESTSATRTPIGAPPSSSCVATTMHPFLFRLDEIIRLCNMHGGQADLTVFFLDRKLCVSLFSLSRKEFPQPLFAQTYSHIVFLFPRLASFFFALRVRNF